MRSIIIPVFNQSAYTRVCLDALKDTCGSFDSYEIIIIDNCSSDDTPSVITEFIKINTGINLKYIRNQKNSGFTVASNQGAASASGEILIFLNNDTIPQAGWISSLETVLLRSEVGIVGPKLLYPETLRVNHAGYVYSPKAGGFYPLYHNYPGNFKGVSKERSFQALLGACLMMRKVTFESIQGFEELGLEDIDLCLRVQKELGLSVIYVPSAVVYHHGSVTHNNSIPGSFPVYSNADFSARWISKGLSWDDYLYYIEDQILPPTDEASATASYQTLEEGISFLHSGDFAKAQEFFSKSIKIYPGNTDALSELIILGLSSNDLKTERLSELCNELLKQGNRLAEAMMFVAIVYKKLGSHSRMLEVLNQIDSLEFCSADIKSISADMRDSKEFFV